MHLLSRARRRGNTHHGLEGDLDLLLERTKLLAHCRLLFLQALASLFPVLLKMEGEQQRIAVEFLRFDACGQFFAGWTLIGAAALKLRGSELQQSILEMMMELLARHGLAYQMDAMVAGWNGDLIGPEGGAGLIHEHFYRRAATIYAGSSEIQRNIIAKGALGL